MSAGQSAITACVIARDEADNLAEVLPGLRWADEVLVVLDTESADGSEGVASPLADRVAVRPFTSFARFRNEALQLAGGTWIFFVDADERVSQGLGAEVRAAVARSELDLAADPSAATVGYWVPRLNIILGRLVRGGGWFPDHQLRLFRRDRGRYDEGRPVHEVVILDGPSGYLTQPLLHLNYRSISQLFAKQRRYTEMEATALRELEERPRARALLGAPLREFNRRYLELKGWADGPVGLLLSATLAYYAFQRVRLARRGEPQMNTDERR